MDYISDVWNWTIIMSIIGAVTGITALWFSYLNSRKINSFIHKYENVIAEKKLKEDRSI